MAELYQFSNLIEIFVNIRVGLGERGAKGSLKAPVHGRAKVKKVVRGPSRALVLSWSVWVLDKVIKKPT